MPFRDDHMQAGGLVHGLTKALLENRSLPTYDPPLPSNKDSLGQDAHVLSKDPSGESEDAAFIFQPGPMNSPDEAPSCEDLGNDPPVCAAKGKTSAVRFRLKQFLRLDRLHACLDPGSKKF
jgi:hypothetical protein